MTFKKLIIVYAITTIVFFVVDILWLGVIAKDFYYKYLGQFFREKVNWPAAIIFYLLYILGIIIFAVKPGYESSSLLRAVTMGALFGFFTYATYDLTNLATLRDWPLTIVVVDIIWGVILCTIVSTAGYLAATRLL
jgi:uncharacterized membrane protein